MASLNDLLASRPGLQPDQSQSGDSLAGLGGVISAAMAPLVTAANTLTGAIQKLTDVIGKDQPAKKPAREGGPEKATPAKAAGGGGPSVPNIGGLIAGNPIVAAIGAIPAALGALTAAVIPFVRAFNPAIVEMFSRALDNVQATIGSALAPILEIFTDALRQINSMIAPTFERLRPVMEAFANHLTGILLPALDLFLELGKALMPLIGVAQQIQQVIDTVFKGFLALLSGGLALLTPLFKLLAIAMQPFIFVMQILSKAFEAQARVIETVNKIISAIFDGLIDLVSGLLAPFLGQLPGITDIFDAMERVVKKVIENLVLFAANLFALIGFTSGLKALQKAFTRERGEGKVAAPKDLGFTTLEEQMKKLTLAAAGAVGGARARSQEELLSGLDEKLKEIVDSGPQFGKQFKEIADDIKSIAKALTKGGEVAQDGARNGFFGLGGMLLSRLTRRSS